MKLRQLHCIPFCLPASASLRIKFLFILLAACFTGLDVFVLGLYIREVFADGRCSCRRKTALSARVFRLVACVSAARKTRSLVAAVDAASVKDMDWRSY